MALETKPTTITPIAAILKKDPLDSDTLPPPSSNTNHISWCDSVERHGLPPSEGKHREFLSTQKAEKHKDLLIYGLSKQLYSTKDKVRTLEAESKCLPEKLRRHASRAERRAQYFALTALLESRFVRGSFEGEEVVEQIDADLAGSTIGNYTGNSGTSRNPTKKEGCLGLFVVLGCVTMGWIVLSS
jgi:hypothetical protein